MQELKDEVIEIVGHLFSKSMIQQFDDPNNRLLIAIHCLRMNHIDIAISLLHSIVLEGPQRNMNHHFAYVRSLVEIAEIEASKGKFSEAEQLLSEALVHFPESMSYMMSYVHLQVYLAYYQFQSGKKNEAIHYISAICHQEKERFYSLLEEDAYVFVSPGLSYAYHQWALFYASESQWKQAFLKYQEFYSYAADVDKENVKKANHLFATGCPKEAFYCLIEALNSNSLEEN